MQPCEELQKYEQYRRGLMDAVSGRGDLSYLLVGVGRDDYAANYSQGYTVGERLLSDSDDPFIGGGSLE